VIGYRSQVSVARPPDAVFPLLADPALQATWSDVPMQPQSPGPLAVGSRAEVRFGGGGMSATLVLEVTALEPARLLAFRSVSGPASWTGEYRFEATGDGRGTLVTAEGSVRLTGFYSAFEGMAAPELRRGIDRQLEALKAVAERG
jgi:uncharacterized protein YndB with AHSA1/START domain